MLCPCIKLSMEASCETLHSLLYLFRQLQEERAQCYRLFEEGHKIYLGTAPSYEFEKFKNLVHDITDEFKRISKEVIAIEKRTRSDFKDSKTADIIEKIQDDEKFKLELTVKLQLTRQSVIDHPANPEHEIQVNDLRNKLMQVTGQINEYLAELKFKENELF